MLAQPCWGRAWQGRPKPRRRSWLRKQSAQALQTAIKTRVVSTGRRGGPSWTTSASGETLERRLWAIKKRAPSKFDLLGIADRLPQRGRGTVKETLHPGALAAGVVILARRLARGSRAGRRHASAALLDGQVAALIASIQRPIQPQLHSQARACE